MSSGGDDETRAANDSRSRSPGAYSTTLIVDHSSTDSGDGTYGAAVGDQIAGRYRLLQALGHGGYGTVWEAEDELAHEIVAVKLLGDRPGRDASRVRREIATLRLLRLPGVVQLLDEGRVDGCSFLVMERIVGRPFPGGKPGPRRWSEIAGTVIALLEALARVHAAGIVHRDLKPSNVLVGDDGRPTLLDFGISCLAPAIADPRTGDEELLGTPLYIAPEQILGDPPTAQTDLYTLGVMLYEVLADRLPQDADNLQALLRMKILEPAPSLASVAPEVPERVAAIVDRMLDRRPSERPRSAAEVLGSLKGEPVPAPELPWIGPRDAVDAVIAAGLGHRSIDVVGPRGSGRSRCLREAAAALAREGVEVLWPAADLPVIDARASLTPAIEEAAAAVEERIAWALAAGAAVLVDDADRLHPALASAIARCRVVGPVIRALEANTKAGSVVLAPLEETSMRALFAGRDRILHLREDAARALAGRTEGLPARVVEEVSAWVRAGLARWDGDRLVVDRDSIDRLETGLRIAAPLFDASAPSLPGHLEELLRWIELASPQPEPWVLVAVTGLSSAAVDAAIEDLIVCGAVRRTPDGRIEARRRARLASSWSEEQTRSAQRAIAKALAPGAPGRLVHLLLGIDDQGADEADAIAFEARQLAQRLAGEGQLGKAVLVLGEGARAVRWATPAPGEFLEPLLALWLEIAVAEHAPTALDEVIYEIQRADLPTSHLEQLARAALAIFNSPGIPALELADLVPPFDDPALERHRHAVRVLAARRCPIERQEAVVADAEPWVSAYGDGDAKAALASWTARLRYRQGRFDEAAALYTRAAQGAAWLTDRIVETLSAASSLMEAFRHDEAARWAENARTLAMSCRLPYLEARAEWILRTNAYRTGRAMVPDIEFLESLARMDVADLTGLACMTEAAVAYRAGMLDTAVIVSEQGRRIWARMGREDTMTICRALAVASGSPASAEEVEALVQRAHACPIVGLGIQILALLTRAHPTLTARRADVDRLLAGIPRDHWKARMDVLSVEESLAAVNVEG